MANTLVEVTAPVKAPIDLAVVKNHLRVDITTDDQLIADYLDTARHDAESFLWRALITQTWRLDFDTWPGSVIALPKPPLQSVTSIKYTDIDGNQSTFSSDNYRVDIAKEPGEIVLKKDKSWPTDELLETGAIQITFVCGYGDDPTDIPYDIRQGILLKVSEFYEMREPTYRVLVRSAASSAELRWWPRRFFG